MFVLVEESSFGNQEQLMLKDSLRVLGLASGKGTTIGAICTAIQKGRLSGVQLVGVVASSSKAGVIERLKSLQPECRVTVMTPTGKSPDEFGEEILAFCRTVGVDFIGQYGWLKKTPRNVIEVFGRRIINQHNAPLDPGRPDFGGQGMHGLRSHAAVLHFACLIDRPFTTEATAQFVDPEHFDLGDLVHRQPLDLAPDDTPATLRDRLLPLEYEVQIETLRRAAAGQLAVYQRSSPLILPHEVLLWRQAIAAAWRDFLATSAGGPY